jgi:hypothetical protein
MFWWHWGQSRTETPHVLAINVAQSTYEVERRQVRSAGACSHSGGEARAAIGGAAFGARARAGGGAGLGGTVSHAAVGAAGFDPLAGCSSKLGALELGASTPW